MIASSLANTGGQRTTGEHITVALTPRVADQLRCLRQTTDLSSTDLTNRAITSYVFLSEQMRAGNELMVRDNRTGETRLVRFV